jgi:hypothetical protein
MGGGRIEKCQKRTNNGLALSLLRSIRRPIVRSLSLSFCLLPFIILICQPHPTTVQTENRRRKEEEK